LIGILYVGERERGGDGQEPDHDLWPKGRRHAMERYARITPHHLAALSLRRGADALERAASDPTTWFFIILDLYRALYCALIAALSGSAEIGAYSDKLQAEWREYFEASRDDPDAKSPTGAYVLRFEELLSRAENGTSHMSGPPLKLTPEQRADILRLKEFRGDLEHVKPLTWCLEVGGLPRISANAARAFATLLQSFSHRLEMDELAEVEAAISKFANS
jgi:hypothetical protein